MAANLKAEMSMKADKFDKTIIASQKQIKNFENGIKGISSSVMKFAAGFGAVVGATELFKEAILSTQTTADLLNNSIDTAKRSTEAFFRSLITGDWSVFKNGVSSAIEEMKTLSQMLDDFGDKKLSFDFIKSQDLAKITEYETIARDTELPAAERKKAVADMRKEIDSLNGNAQEYISDLQDVLRQKYKASFGIDISTDDLEYFFRQTNFGNKEALDGVEKFRKGLKELNGEATKVRTSANTRNPMVFVQKTEEGEKAIEIYKQENAFLYAQSLLLEEGDKSRKETIDLLTEQYSLMREISSLEKKANRTASGVNRVANSSVPKDSSKIIYQSGSLGKLNEEIQAFQAQLTAATDGATRQGARDGIAALKNEIKWIELEVKINTPAFKKEIEKSLEVTKTAGISVSKRSDGSDIESGAIDVNSDFAGVQSIIEGYNNEQMRAIELQNQWATGIGTTASGFQSLSTALSQVAGDNEEAARTAKAFMMVSQGLSAAQAIYEGVKAGWPAMLFAIPSALASVVSAFAVAGSFESGGIVPGNSFSGDRLTARVNSGEMILNRAQQSNLFNLLNGGGGSSGSGNEIKLRIKGSDLIGVINNETKKRSRF
jgi:hypothetical protein